MAQDEDHKNSFANKLFKYKKPIESTAFFQKEFIDMARLAANFIAIAAFLIMLSVNIRKDYSMLEYGGIPVFAFLSGIIFFCMGIYILGFANGRYPNELSFITLLGSTFGGMSVFFVSSLFWSFEGANILILLLMSMMTPFLTAFIGHARGESTREKI